MIWQAGPRNRHRGRQLLAVPQAREAAHKGTRIILTALVMVLTARAEAVFQSEHCVSQNKTVYMILSTSNARVRVTNIVLANDTVTSCIENSAEPVQTSLVVGGAPLANLQRTSVIGNLTTNAGLAAGCLPPAFEANAAGGFGILTLPDGSAGGIRISANPNHADCMPPSSPCLPIAALTDSDTKAGLAYGQYPVPAALPLSLSRFAPTGPVTSGSVNGVTQVFPSSAVTPPALPAVSRGRESSADMTDEGETPDQQVTIDDTTGSAVGNLPPGNNLAPNQVTPDGFVLRGGGDCTGKPNPNCQAIVFMAEKNGSNELGMGAAGFLTTDEKETWNDTVGRIGLAQFDIVPTASPTPTATEVSTPSPTNTPAIPTPTATLCARCFIKPISYRCYNPFVHPSLPVTFALPKSVHLADRWQDQKYDVLRSRGLCVDAALAPEILSGDLGEFDRPGLVAFKLKRAKDAPRHEPRRGLRVRNAFGELFVDTVRPNRLLVASNFDLDTFPSEPVRGRGETSVDHYTCYSVKGTPGKAPLARDLHATVADRLGASRSIRIKKLTHLCAPTSVDGGVIQDTQTHLACYRAARPQGQSAVAHVAGALFTANELGSSVLGVGRDGALCVPSSVE